jgi:hypothetical protein
MPPFITPDLLSVLVLLIFLPFLRVFFFLAIRSPSMSCACSGYLRKEHVMDPRLACIVTLSLRQTKRFLACRTCGRGKSPRRGEISPRSGTRSPEGPSAFLKFSLARLAVPDPRILFGRGLSDWQLNS